MNVLVTGGAGYVGSICCAQLLMGRHRVVIVDDLSTGHAAAVSAGAVFYQRDFGDQAEIVRTLRAHQIDTIFHFAAKALIPESVTNPGVFFDINVASGIALLEAARRAGIRRFVFSSSAAVYGNPEGIPIPEEHPKNPVNSYGETKLMFERILEWYSSAYGWTVFAFRYFNAAGATGDLGERHDPETHIIPLLLSTAAGERRYFQIYGTDYPTMDGTCLRDYVHVSDIAAAHILALRANRPGFHAYNIGTGHGHTVCEVIDMVEGVTGQRIPVRSVLRRPGDPAMLCASPEKLMRELGWTPRYSSLENIIASAWRWKQQPKPAAVPSVA